MLTKPCDREVVCYASAWDVTMDNDLRIKMCIKQTEEDLVVIHHELGHNYYYHAYYKLPALYQQGANDGFHEAIGDALILVYAMDSAITRALQLGRISEDKGRIPTLMTQLFVAQAHESIFDALREMLMWMSQEEEWSGQIRDINNYYSLSRVNTFSLRRKIAKHVIEAGGYAL